jgi:hypothetical protein
MSRQRWSAVVLVVAGGVLFVVAPSDRLIAQGPPQEVAVTNFPATQRIDGMIEVRGPVQLSKQAAIRNITVPPVSPSDTTRWVDAGVVSFGGFSHVVLSLQGMVKGSVKQSGAVSAVLIPNEDSIQEAFNELGQIYFPLQVTAARLTPQTLYFVSDQPRHTIAFQDYRVLLYNSTDKTATVNLFAYLTN